MLIVGGDDKKDDKLKPTEEASGKRDYVHYFGNYFIGVCMDGSVSDFFG